MARDAALGLVVQELLLPETIDDKRAKVVLYKSPFLDIILLLPARAKVGGFAA